MGYNINLNIKDKLCIIIGGGHAAELKAGRLIKEGARLRIIAPTILPSLINSGIDCREKEYSKTDLFGAFLVFALTDNDTLNSLIISDAHEAGCLVCCGKKGDFSVPSTQYGKKIRVSVTTGYPKLSAKLSRKILEYDELCTVLDEIRDKILALDISSQEKNKLLEYAVSEELLEKGLYNPKNYMQVLNEIINR